MSPRKEYFSANIALVSTVHINNNASLFREQRMEKSTDKGLPIYDI